MNTSISTDQNTTKILGVDPSTYLGTCLLTGDTASPRLIHFKEAKGFHRLQLIAKSFDSLIQEHHPDLVVVEGYAYGNRNSIVSLVEIGTLIRMALYEAQIPWYDAPPSLLKRFVTGKGNAKKPDVAKAVKERWGFESTSDDVVDAYGLARLGQALKAGDETYLKGVTYHDRNHRNPSTGSRLRWPE